MTFHPITIPYVSGSVASAFRTVDTNEDVVEIKIYSGSVAFFAGSRKELLAIPGMTPFFLVFRRRNVAAADALAHFIQRQFPNILVFRLLSPP